MDFFKKYKWKTVLALVASLFAIIYSANWFWAIIIFIGLAHIIRSGKLHFVEVAEKEKNPIIYWIMVCVLFSFGIYSSITYLLSI